MLCSIPFGVPLCPLLNERVRVLRKPPAAIYSVETGSVCGEGLECVAQRWTSLCRAGARPRTPVATPQSTTPIVAKSHPRPSFYHYRHSFSFPMPCTHFNSLQHSASRPQLRTQLTIVHTQSTQGTIHIRPPLLMGFSSTCPGVCFDSLAKCIELSTPLLVFFD